MAPRSPQPRAGGVLLAIALMGGAGVGLRLGEPTLGLIGGAALGLALCLLIWALDRR